MSPGGVTVLANAFVAVFTGFLALSTIGLWAETKKLWKAETRALETTNRAFVSIDGFEQELTTHADRLSISHDIRDLPEDYEGRSDLYITRFAVAPRWKNGGNTPTKNMTIQINWTRVLDGRSPEFTYADQRKSFFLPPKATEQGSFIEIPAASEIVGQALGKRLQGEPIYRLLIWGRADYEDVFDHPHVLEWCYEIRFDAHKGRGLGVRFIQWDEYNRTDYDQKG